MANRIVQICVISGDEVVDRFMHAADVFEPCKMYAQPAVFKATFITDPGEDDIHALIEIARKTAARTHRVLAAAFIVGSNIGYVNEDVKVISNGSHIFMLDDVLAAYGFVREAADVAP